MDDRSQVRDFLVCCRAKVTPEQVGLPATTGARRVAGLRRGAVAQLAGVSVESYTQLERGPADHGQDGRQVIREPPSARSRRAVPSSLGYRSESDATGYGKQDEGSGGQERRVEVHVTTVDAGKALLPLGSDGRSRADGAD